MTRENIRPALNQKLVLRVEDTRTKEYKSNFHDAIDYRYAVKTANGNSAFLYVPVDGHLAIRRANVADGDDIQLIKAKVGGEVVFTVMVLGDSHDARGGGRAQPETRQAQPARPALPARVYVDDSGTPAAVAPIAQPIKAVHPLEDTMQRCFLVAGRALWHAYEELTAQGCAYDVPTIEDARAAGISMFIERTRNNASQGGR